MSRAAPWACVLMLLTLSGCTKDEDYVEVLREQTAAWKETADILATIKDDKTMAAAKAALDERQPRFDAISRKAKALPKPSERVQQRLEDEKYAMQAALTRLVAESERVSKLPGGAEFMGQLTSNSQGLWSAVKK